MSKCVRTTIRLDDGLFRQARQYASEHHQTFTGLVEDALRSLISRNVKPTSGKQKITLPTFHGGGTLPGVDLDHSASLYDIMDGIR